MRAYVHASTTHHLKEEVFVHEVAVPVLLGGPRPGPHRPAGRAGAGLVADAAVQGVEHGLVRRQRLLGDHVAHEADEVVVGDLPGALSQLPDLVVEGLGGGVRQVVLRLPGPLHGLEEHQDVVRRPRLERLEDLPLLRGQRVRHGAVYLARRGEGLPAGSSHPSFIISIIARLSQS
ncbi:ubiquitin-associated (UBA)/TS-N domain-containing protein [Zea mays]|uniref:Ubiquitin-associated (UBA)/TS-N domain-containing protein n=1 Tax=Zea mays TaxID=4577 RepID=C0PKE6_MAIZE|nr:unknown [Zea mays]AQK52700.1 ubiquitin-associated (UBA)/TS-N domain-containing protein [Zea mays]